MAAELSVSLKLETGKRWWFDIARIVTIALIYLGAVKDVERAAHWLAHKGVWYRAVID
jgi:hypothetical protein